MKKVFFLLFILIINIEFSVAQNNFYKTDSIQEIRISIKEKKWNFILDSLYNLYEGGDRARIAADLTINGTKIKDVGIRYKGYSSESINYIKNPYNIDLDYKIKNRNYNGITSIKLANITSDPSLIREVLSFEIVRKYMPAPRANFANVYVNDTLIGLYTNVESIDDKFTNLHFNSSKNSFFKGVAIHPIVTTANNANLTFLGNDPNFYYSTYDNESNNEFGWLDLIKLTYMLNNDTSHLSEILNIDRALWMIALDYTLVNLDSYIGYSQNYYIYKDNFGRFNPIIWDMNMSFGGFKSTDGISVPPNGLSIQQLQRLNPIKMLTSSPISPRPLIVNLLKNPMYKKMYLAHIRTILNENFKNNWYLTFARALDSLIDIHVQNDTNKFYPYWAFQLNIDTTVTVINKYPPYSSLTITGIKNLMSARISYLDTIKGMQGEPVITNIECPVLPEQGSLISIRAEVNGATEVYLNYRFNTGDAFKRIRMTDIGNNSYAGNFILNGKTVQYFIYAQNDSAGVFSPERAEYEFYTIQPKLKQGDIVINEILIDSISGEIEILNTTSENQRLTNVCLSNARNNLNRWLFPDTCIKAKNFIVVKTNQNGEGLSTNFLLENTGELYLSYETNSIIDSLNYGNQIIGTSYGRFPNGFGNYIYMQPTIGKNNLIGNFKQTDILIFPNPTSSNTVYLKMICPQENASYEIYNSLGQIIQSGNFNTFNSNEEIFNIDVTSIKSGVCFIKVNSNNGFVVKKFLIQK